VALSNADDGFPLHGTMAGVARCHLEWSLVNLPETYVQRAVLGGGSVGVKHRTLEL